MLDHSFKMPTWLVSLSPIPAGCYTRDINSREWPKTLLLHPLSQTLFSSSPSNPKLPSRGYKSDLSLALQPFCKASLISLGVTPPSLILVARTVSTSPVSTPTHKTAFDLTYVIKHHTHINNFDRATISRPQRLAMSEPLKLDLSKFEEITVLA